VEKVKPRPGVALVIASIFLAASPSWACKSEAPAKPSLAVPDIIDSARHRMAAVDSFHFVLDHAGGGTPIAGGLEMEKAVGDVARPDRLQAEIRATLASIKVKVKLITVGQRTYITNPLNQRWEPLPNEFRAVSIFDPGTGVAAILEKATNLTELGDEKVSGHDSYYLAGEVAAEALRPITVSSVEGATIDAEIWIDRQDFSLHKIKLEGQITKKEKPGIVRTIELSRFDQEVSIELPE
jgi:lipoprotein LprG